MHASRQHCVSSRVVEALRRNGLEQNTLVVFTADNGAAGSLSQTIAHAPTSWTSSPCLTLITPQGI